MDAVGIVDSALRIVAAIVPGLLALTTGKQTDEEAIEAMTSAAKRMKVREDGGTWDNDLAARKAWPGRGVPTPSDVLTPRDDADDS